MKLLLVTMYFPPSGGGGVQRPLKFASQLPALGIETHVLAPDDSKWVHSDAELALPTQAWVHRARYVGPGGRRIADEQHGRSGIARREGIDVVLTTSPPGSVHLIGAAVKKATGAAWVADLRDSIALHPHRSNEGVAALVKQKSRAGIARLVAHQADVIVTAAEAITEETRGISPKGRVVTIANGCDFDDFAGLEYRRADRLRLTHAGSFFGKRDPKPFLRALADSGLEDVTVRFLGDFRPADREYLESLELGDRVELIDYVPRRESLRLQRDSDALLLLIPEAGGRGKGVLSGKVFEYLAAERPILALVPPEGAAAQLIRDTGAGVVAPPDDVAAIRDALLEVHARWRDGKLDGAPLSAEWREKLSRASRVEELADVLRSLR
jgi:glycosyltransferase involved in cell wall biosynthesis